MSNKKSPVKIVVFGPTGMIGGRIVSELERRGHAVVGASRATGADATDPASVAAVVAGVDAVVSAISGRSGAFTLAQAGRSLAEGLRRAGVRRLVIVGGAASLEVAPGVRLIDTPDFHEEWKPEALQHVDALEFYRRVDGLDWTFVSPAALIQPGKRTGRYRLGGDQLLVDEDGKSEISAEDYAIAIADLVEQGSHARQRVTAAW
jgi:uncharacterized protein